MKSRASRLHGPRVFSASEGPRWPAGAVSLSTYTVDEPPTSSPARPLHDLLETILAQRRLDELLVGPLERTVWSGMQRALGLGR